LIAFSKLALCCKSGAATSPPRGFAGGVAAGIEIDQILPAAREARAVELGITTLSMVWPVPRGA